METTTEVKPKSSILTPKLNQPKVAKADVGALWGHAESNGDEYFTGEITLNGTKTLINVRRNVYKTEDKHPDWRIYIAIPKTKETIP